MRYTISSLVVLLFLYASTGHGQTHLDSLLTHPFFLKDDSLQQAGRYQDAIDQLEQAARDYRSNQRWRDYFYTENKICENLWRLGQYDTAWQVVQQVQKESAERLGERHSAGVYTYFNTAFLHHIYGRYEDALADYHTALSIAEQHPASYPLLHDDLYHGASISYLSSFQYDSAFAYCHRGLRIRVKQGEAAQVEVAKSYAQLGNIHNVLGNQDSSLWYSQWALAAQLMHSGEDHPHVAKYQAYVGNGYYKLGIYDSAIYYCHKALSGYRKYLGEDHYYTALTQSVLGDIYYDQGDYHASLSHHQRALNIFLTLFGKDHPSLIDRFNVLANVQNRLHNDSEALKNYREGLRISKVVGDEDIQHLYNNIGDLYADENQYDSALWYSRKALSVGKRVYGPAHRSMAILYGTLGETFHKQSQYDSALWYYQQALLTWNERQVTNHADLAFYYEKLGDVYYTLNDCERALANYQNSLTANTIDPKHQTRSDFKQYISSERLLSTVSAQAQALRKHYEQTGDTSQLKRAFSTYLRYDSLINQFQGNRYRQDDQLFAQRTAKKVYEAALSTGMLLYQLTRHSAYWRQMFQLAEQSRTIALRRATASNEAKKFSRIPEVVTQQEQDVKIERAQYQTLLQKSQQAGDTAQVRRCQTILLGIDQSYNSLIRTMEQDYPQYHQLKYESEVVSVTELQRKLDQNTTALAYFIGKHTGYAFAITSQSFRVTSFPNDTTLTDQIKQLRNAITPRASDTSYQAFVAAARGLYQMLLQPITSENSSSDDTRQLLIIPDGQLSRLPFELLLTAAPPAGAGNYQSLPYLIRQYKVSYSYSASWQFRKRTATRIDTNPSYLAMAPTYGSTNSLAYGALRNEVTPLQWNQEEVADLGTYLSGNALVGSDATESRFKREAARHQILHLATHALVNDHRSERTGLVFAPPNDSLEDGLLQMYELYAMELPAQLAVLSACNTGGGQLEEGEGVMSLARAFAYAGCPSIVMSHWAVDDRVTAQLMKYFYGNMSKGLDKAEALRQAKLSLLASDDFPANPFYWASFSVVGDTQPLTDNSNQKNVLHYLFLALIITVLTAGIVYYLK